MTPQLTRDDWYLLLVSIILVAVLPGWVVLVLPLVPLMVIVLLAGIVGRW
jgi:hypothetical protein